MADQDPAKSALQDYFNCHHCPISPTLRKELADRLFNVLTPETVNRLYTIQTTFGERTYSPLQLATQTENTDLTKRLLVELGADILFSEGAHGLHPLRSLFSTYAVITYWDVQWSEHVHPVRHDALVDIIASGLARVKDTSRLPAVFDQAVRQSGITSVARTELLRKVGPALRKEMRDIAWSRRRHLVASYYSDENY